MQVMYQVTVKRLIDLAILAASFWLAFLLRFDWNVPDETQARFIAVFPYAVMLEVCSLWVFGVVRLSWRFASLQDIKRIAAALITSTFVLVAVRVAAHWAAGSGAEWASVAVVPHGALIINFVLAFLGVSGARVARRFYGERQRGRARGQTSAAGIRTLLVGAGRGGSLVARELSQRPQLGISPVGFLDDRPGLRGTIVHGLPVLGQMGDLAAIAKKYKAEQVLITISTATGSDVRRLKKACDEAGLRARIVPGMAEVVRGEVVQPFVRDIVVTDLLRRDPVELDQSAIERLVRDRTVMVTGAGGSIGSELCRQLMRFRPRQLVLVERAENNLFLIHSELVDGETEVVPCMADVCDSQRMHSLFDLHRPTAVFHAAAHKHVPMMEWNACEALKNNVFGTRTVADLADQFGVGAFVMISTDKAVNPSSVMGATKRVAEIYVQALSQKSKTRFVTVRFGNVLGSAGSVVPVFQQQIKRGGPVTVTHPEMRRYFMTIPEACQLVVQAASMGEGGEIFILDMGDPVRISDLARDLIRLSGKEDEIELRFTGIRPGEKLFEELSLADENAVKTKHAKIFVGNVRGFALEDANRGLTRLWHAAISGDSDRARAALSELVPEYSPALGTGAREERVDALPLGAAIAEA